jgi:hypothetical protein
MLASCLNFIDCLIEVSDRPVILSYLDPGAGSMLYQVLIAGVLSTMYFARNSLQLVKLRLFDKKSKT